MVRIIGFNRDGYNKDIQEEEYRRRQREDRKRQMMEEEERERRRNRRDRYEEDDYDSHVGHETTIVLARLLYRHPVPFQKFLDFLLGIPVL